MVVAAGLLVLAGLGLFVAGVLTAVTVWYWACVVACALAAVLLLVARLRTPAGTGVPAGRPESVPPPARSVGRPAAGASAGTASTAETPATAIPAAVPVAPAAPDEPATGEDPQSPEPPAPVTAARPTAAARDNSAPAGPADPPEEDVEFTDLLMVVDLTDEVLVVDEHPRYHLAGCPWLAGRPTFPLPVKEARTDGFTPCGRCGPDRFLAGAERARRAARRR
ncbi:hypothetical protein [Geodermatophilus amargosae]|uniref:hypothetical protein n=1 Tax=Geodermatophilus amargosae TaxID=1296565 RepID=UPI0034DF23ED